MADRNHDIAIAAMDAIIDAYLDGQDRSKVEPEEENVGVYPFRTLPPLEDVSKQFERMFGSQSDIVKLFNGKITK